MPPIPNFKGNDFVNNQIVSYNQIPDEDLNFEPFTEQQIEPYARISKSSYANLSKRQDVGNYKYLEGESTEDLAVYENDDEYHIGIRGTSPNSMFRDFMQDSAIALGSLSYAAGIDPFITDTDKIQKKIDKLKIKKPVSISGHSKGGTLASFVGVNNPDVRVTTFNRGDALPFVGDYIKCAINGCQNINNYRISGDFAGVLGSKFSNQRYFNLKPKIPSQQTQQQARLASGYFIDEQLYIPHSLNNFYDRKQDSLLSHHTYARPLAAKIGKYGTIAAVGAATFGYKKYLENLKPKLLEKELEEFIEFGGDPVEDYPLLENKVDRVVNPMLENFQSKLHVIKDYGVLGTAIGVGDILGVGIYDMVYGRELEE